jgi:hypothetical protein
LQQLETILSNKIFAWTTGLNLEQSGPNGWKCETDFVVITDGYREGPPLYDSILHLAQQRNISPTKIERITAPEEAFPFVVDGSAVAFLVKEGGPDV